MTHSPPTRNVPRLLQAAAFIFAAAPLAAQQAPTRVATAGTTGAARPASAAAAARPADVTPPTADYWVYVGAESADLIHRIRFGPGGTVVEKTIPVGEQAAEMEGPHGLAVSPDRQFLYMTTGHGQPDGKLWKFAIPADTIVAPGTLLGNFPASLDVSPDGMYAISANFNLHGDMVPSSMSVTYTPTLTEVARVVTCTMPHGSRFEKSGRFQYSGCMMDDQLVEVDAVTFTVSRRFSLAKGREGPLDAAAGAMAMDHGAHGMHGAGATATAPPVDPADVGYAGMKHEMVPSTCSPTWAQPSADGAMIYVACNKADEILEVSRAEWRITRRMKTGRGVYNLAVTPDGTLLVATLKQGAGVQIFRLADGASLASLPTSNKVAHGVAISDDSRYAFISSEGIGAEPGRVDVIDLQALVKVGTADVGQQAGGIAFWKQAAAR
jgi:DNA-binding beta-propeller fold protein YncE